MYKTNMPRTPTGSDKKLLEAARAMVGQSGIPSLRLREVARRAGVNLGMFHYHFGTKDNFVRRLMQEIYEEFFGRLSLESRGGGDPVDRLKRSLIVFGRFARDQRRLFVALLSEALRGDKSATAYLEQNIPRHFGVVSELVAEGQKAGTLKPLPISVAVSFAIGGMGAPNLMITALERSRSSAARSYLKAWGHEFLSDDAIERRAELVLSALKK